MLQLNGVIFFSRPRLDRVQLPERETNGLTPTRGFQRTFLLRGLKHHSETTQQVLELSGFQSVGRDQKNTWNKLREFIQTGYDFL